MLFLLKRSIPGSGSLRNELLKGFYLGNLLIEPLTGQITGPFGRRHLTPKAAEILLQLASKQSEIVTREDLLAAVWGEGEGSREALSHTISALRQALDDHAEAPVFIQTLPRRGYRLLKSPVPRNHAPDVTAAPAADGLAKLGWIAKLKRRGVVEAAIAYAVVGWLIIQVTDIVFDQLHLPDFLGTFITILVIAGFPIAMVLSWYLDFRDGRAVLHELSPADAKRKRFSRTYVSVIGALAIAGLFVYAYDQSIGLPTARAIPRFVAEPPPVVENSFAVLPFLNVDGSDESGIFATGLADDVISGLSRVAGLHVSSRGDSFTLDPHAPSGRVRERLRVANYLSGSVETVGDTIRVIVQVVDSATGFQVTSRRFDRPSRDIFDIRDEITNLTVSTVQATLPTKAQASILQDADTPELSAYLLYRRGIEAMHLPRTIETVNTALNWFNAALSVDPDYTVAHAGKCAAYVEAYTETEDAGMIDKATTACATALRLDPNLAVVYAALGKLYETTGRLADAEDAFDNALDSDPSNAEALQGLGDVYARQNRFEEAEAILRKAVGLHPGSESALNTLGAFLFRSGRYAEAAEQFEYVVALNPGNMNGYQNLGTSQLMNGDFTSALPTYHKALEISPTQVAYSNLGLLYYYLHDFGAAVENHSKAVELAPNDYLTRSNLGDALWFADRRDDARREFERAGQLAVQDLRVNPNDPFTMMDLAWIRAMQDEPAAARAHIEKALPLAPEDPYTHYISALVAVRGGDRDTGIAALDIAVARGYSRQLLFSDPQLDELHDDPRFIALVSEVEARQNPVESL